MGKNTGGGKEALGKISVARAVKPVEEIAEPTVGDDAQDTAWYRNRIIQAGLAALAVVVFGWLLGMVFVSKITAGHSSISAHSSDAVLANLMKREAAAYRLKITYPDGKTRQFKLQEAGLTLDEKSSIKASRARQTFARQITWWQPVHADLRFHKDTSQFNKFVASSISITAQPSSDATLTVEKGTIHITDAVTGKQYGLNKPEQVLKSAASELKTTPIKLQTLDVNPALTAKILQPYKQQLEQILNQPAKLTVGYRTVTPSPEDIAGWLDITPNDKTKKVDITVNSGKVVEYINSVASASIRPARAQVSVTMPDGSSQVLIPGENGVDVTNKSGIASTLADNLLSAKGFDYSLPVRWQAFEDVNTGYYPKWIEVDLTSKRLYAYEYTNLVATYLASAGAPATPTVTGQYSIYAKFEQQNMQGENVDGSSYYQPNVQWINYFYRDYAIHGNYWRPVSYFGNVNSSHGCVGLLNGDASWIYNWAPVGTPVIVHK